MWVLPPRQARFFDDAQRAAIDVLFDAILPPTETSPGAREAKAVDYVDHLLMDGPDVYEDIPELQETYPVALEALDEVSRERFGRGVSALGRADATALLSALQTGSLPIEAGFDQPGFFTLLRAHCIEGCFGDPRWGGNKGGVMWRWLGYPVETVTSEVSFDD